MGRIWWILELAKSENNLNLVSVLGKVREKEYSSIVSEAWFGSLYGS